ncbi:MAG: flagellar motor switch protein FliG [Gammaproteobacteria bacterium]|nr:flagellar motor switch protein FliG [Gammaproteobacteria bacterium]
MADAKKPGKKDDVSACDRAAILLLSLGEESAAEILKHLGPKEVHKLGSAMAELQNVSKEQAQTVLQTFHETVDNETSLGMGNDDYVRKMLVQALGEDKAEGLIDRILMGSSVTGLEQMKWMDPRAIAEIIRLEHPQIIAIVLSYLDSDLSADVLSILPDKVQIDVVMRIATLDRIQPAALHELNLIMEQQFSGSASVKSSSVGGVKRTADILNFLDSSTEEELISQIKDSDSDLGQQIQDLMFVFDNLSEIDDRGIQALLREVSSESLMLALKGADSGLQEKIFKNMSKRAAEMLRDDLDSQGPAKLSDVESAQKEILAIARRMAESGEINMGGKGDELVG